MTPTKMPGSERTAAEAAELKRAIPRFYDVVSPHFARLWGPHLHDGLYRTGRETKEEAQEELIRHLAARSAIATGATVLDVGCGLGGTSVWLAKTLGCSVTGITISPVQVEMARALAARERVSAEFLLMDAETMSFARTFDAIWIVGALGHFVDQRGFVGASARVLRPGGRFVLGDWMLGGGVGAVEPAKLVELVGQGMLQPYFYPLATYRAWFEAAGYRIVSVEDLTAATERTWDVGLSIVKEWRLLKLAAELGLDFVRFIRSIRAMKRAMARRRIIYGAVVAERT